MKKEIEVFDYANEIMRAVKTGVLLTTKVDGKVNSMTISWGTLGIEWSKPIFTVFVRENRFTKLQLEKNPEFTINIPHGVFDKKILGICGTKSGRAIDKIKELNLTLETPNNISVPAIKELPLTLECRIIYKQKQDECEVTEENKNTFYPQYVDSTFHGANKDFHTAYYGEILSAYIIE
ncbi:flavin reductase family protein [Clostridium botulinum]|uniref:Flavin reductase family protein n=3 Tax=Clostridium botulinum TaxID=1491 RepID=A0A6B4NBD5_CLOBO|nr:flavin reductase family protein [Clostridium botulinum]ACO83915.1 putative flavoredoxin [Clostridium botulinum A2 str. Kyoto]APC79278.1 flavin reductase like domain protein [Clostridium botulinum]APC84511.1 flavin reductase like domain protein [Clostridium botulinum]APH22866.1 flavin reductase like domain protein [Clostridium botulinum]APQ67887.1 flavin reductase like domain protein [Clostridium botulinum]